MPRIKARERLELFDLIRIAVNGDKATAQEWFDRQQAIAQGRNASAAEEVAVVIASEEDAAKFLRSIGR